MAGLCVWRMYWICGRDSCNTSAARRVGGTRFAICYRTLCRNRVWPGPHCLCNRSPAALRSWKRWDPSNRATALGVSSINACAHFHNGHPTGQFGRETTGDCQIACGESDCSIDAKICCWFRAKGDAFTSRMNIAASHRPAQYETQAQVGAGRSSSSSL